MWTRTGPFRTLAWRSQETNVKLREIASRFVEAASTASLMTSNATDSLDRILLTAHQRTDADPGR